LPYVSTSPDFFSVESSSEAIDDREVEEGLARGVSEGEISVEGAEEAVADSVVSKRGRGAVSDGKAVVVAIVEGRGGFKQEVVDLEGSLQWCSRIFVVAGVMEGNVVVSGKDVVGDGKARECRTKPSWKQYDLLYC
jgi:hypothetical protein